MSRLHHRKTLLIIGLSLLLNISHASDTAKEKRWADQVVDSIMVGDAEWLEAGKQKFLAIYAENNTEKAQGAIILAHGTGVHPNWADVIYPLRTQLPDYGWQTLSIQLPILSNDAEYIDYAPLYDEAIPRFRAAVAFLKEKGIANIVIIAHSQGSAMSAYYMAKTEKHDINAFIAIGMPGGFSGDKRMDVLNSLKKITIPTFDLYGERDLEQVLAATKDKKNTAKKAGNKYYSQFEVAGANHFFVGKEEALVKRVRSWLARYAAGLEIKK